MATSASTDFNRTAADIVNKAMRLCGVKGQGSALSAAEMEDGLEALNLMLKTWSTNRRLSLLAEGTITPLLATASYALSAKALRVLSVRRRVSGNDVPLIELSREEYYDLPTKAATGTPNSFYYDPQRTTGTVYLWPTPDAGFVANGSLRYTYRRVIEDIDAQGNDLDLPQEWFEAIAYNLADRLGDEYPHEGQDRIAKRAAELLAQLEGFDQEPASLFMSAE